jgi:hypothetical protein
MIEEFSLIILSIGTGLFLAISLSVIVLKTWVSTHGGNELKAKRVRIRNRISSERRRTDER